MLFEYNFLMFIRENLTSQFMDNLMTFVSALGDSGFIWILLGLALLINKKTRKCGLFMLTALALGYIVGNLGIKNIFARIRPYVQYNVPIIIPNPSEFSFPSGHTLSSFAAAFSLFKFDKRSGTPAIIFASAIAYSRMYLFVHYPSDIVGGIILSLFIVWLTERLFNKLQGVRNKVSDEQTPSDDDSSETL